MPKVGYYYTPYIAYAMKITIPARLRRYGWVPVLVVLVTLGYYYFAGSKGSPTVTSAMVVETVAQGTVTTGIQTTGTIRAAEILDLNVYKTTNRIDTVAIQNGAHVEKGQLLFAFDESDVAVDISESQLNLREAQLTLEAQRAKAIDPNTTITTLRNDIAVLEQNITEYKADLRTALRDYLNADLEAVPSAERYSQQVGDTAPTIGGVYTGTEEGEYRIKVYASGAESGLSYTLTGLERGSFEVYLDAKVALGTQGLTITFPATIANRDEWVVAVPNIYAPEHAVNLEEYEEEVTQIKKDLNTAMVTLANKRTQLAQEERTDTTSQRNLDVETAALAIDRAQVDLQRGRDTQDERRIIAAFSGTVEGVENVVVGATPTNDSNDTVNFGSLISDDFLTTFSLSASDVDTVTVGQKVLVTLTSVPDSEPLVAEVTKVSSLPDSSTVAQYEVSARILDTGSSTVRLRDGMLADVEIVREEKQDVVRVPVAALHFSAGKTYVTVVEDLTKEQEQQLARLGIVRTDLSMPTTYEREVTVGLRGSYVAEITDGLTTGERIKVSENAPATTESAPVVRTGFGAGGGRPPEDHD